MKDKEPVSLGGGTLRPTKTETGYRGRRRELLTLSTQRRSRQFVSAPSFSPLQLFQLHLPLA